MPKKPFLSVIIPLYNEENRAKNINRVVRFLLAKKILHELILVNDGSTDHTASLLEKYSQPNIKIISYPINRGKGWAIRQGMLAAKGQYRLFLDVDLSTPIEELNKFLPQLTESDVLIGTRKAPGARVVVHQPWIRENLGKTFTLLSQVVLAVPVSDFTCGFKLFSAAAAEKVFGRARIDRWGFDSEILFLCQQYGFSIKELPVTWKDDARTKVKFPEDIIKSLSELLAIRGNALRGLYRPV